VIDGVDLSRREVGETFRLSVEEARLLVAERWAVPAEQKSRQPRREQTTSVVDRADDFYRRYYYLPESAEA
jgi:hypothetical protein